MAHSTIQSSLKLPCGAIFKNRLAKASMSDSLADGEGNPTAAQVRLYEKWTEGGAAISFVGEVQGDPRFPENPGNLVLNEGSKHNSLLLTLTSRSTVQGAHLWAQIGHAGALSYLPISHPKGPSPLNIKGLQCVGMSNNEIQALPDLYAKTALNAKLSGFSGVHIHAGHGFLLSQFLSPLFNHRTDQYGGSIESRCNIILNIISEVRKAVGSSFPIGIRMNSTDQLEGGLTEHEALQVIKLLSKTSIDLIDISGGTYFPGAKASSEGVSQGPYFLDFARQAKKVTDIPLMLTGGFKQRNQAIEAVSDGSVDMIGLARSMVINPFLANTWLNEKDGDPQFPKFDSVPPGGITAWYTMRLAALGEDKEDTFDMSLPAAIQAYEKRDVQRTAKWKKNFAALLTND